MEKRHILFPICLLMLSTACQASTVEEDHEKLSATIRTEAASLEAQPDGAAPNFKVPENPPAFHPFYETLEQPTERQIILLGSAQRNAFNAAFARNHGYPQRWAEVAALIGYWPLLPSGQPWPVGMSTEQQPSRLSWIVNSTNLFDSYIHIPGFVPSEHARPLPFTTPLEAFNSRPIDINDKILTQDGGQAWAVQACSFLSPTGQYWLEHGALPPTLADAYTAYQLAVNQDSLTNLSSEYPSAEVYRLADFAYAIYLSGSSRYHHYLVYHQVAPNNGSIRHLGLRTEHDVEIAAKLGSATRLGTLQELLAGVPRVTASQLMPGLNSSVSTAPELGSASTQH